MAKGLSEEQKKKFIILTKKYGLSAEDFFKAPQGFITITRTGVEKIQRGLEIDVTFIDIPHLCNLDTGHFTIKAIAKRVEIVFNDQGKPETLESYVESYGESNPKNTRNAYPIAMAEKRALSRVVLKMANLYELCIYGQDEIEE